MKNKYIICFLLIIDLFFFLFCYGYAVMNPVIMDGTVNLMTSIVGNNLLYPMIISGIIFVCGVILYIFLWEDDYEYSGAFSITSPAIGNHHSG